MDVTGVGWKAADCVEAEIEARVLGHALLLFLSGTLYCAPQNLHTENHADTGATERSGKRDRRERVLP